MGLRTARGLFTAAVAAVASLAASSAALADPGATLRVRAGEQLTIGAAGVPVASRLVLVGSNGADSIRVLAGPRAVADLDADGRADVRLAPGAARPGTILILGAGGDDVIDASLATVPVVLDGGAGDDVLRGGVGADRLVGGTGDDVIDGGGAATATCAVAIDPATGEVEVIGSGGDLADYSASPGPIVADLDPGEQHPGTATSPDGTDTLQGVEHLIGSAGDDTLSGDDEGNALDGGPGDDTIAGDAGDDCMLGGPGDDTFDENEGTSLAQGGSGTASGSDWLFGNAGADTVSYASRTTRVGVFLEPLFGSVPDGADLNGDGDADDSGDERDHVFLDVEHAIGGNGNDLLSANFVSNRADNVLTGGTGNDHVIGGAGNDVFDEGAAASGADDLDGGTGLDTCDYGGRTVGVVVTLEGDDNDGEPGEGDNCGGVRSTGLPGEGQPSSLSNVENVRGGAGDDVLRGQPGGANVLRGGAGDDVLSAFGGTDSLFGDADDDILAGGAGSDALDGGEGGDTADFASAGGAVRIDLATGRGSGQGADTLSAIESVSGSSFADAITGDAGANVLNGNGGDDAIQAAAGDDVANGGAGDDELGGGAGDDTVSGGTGADALRGSAGDDRLSGGPGADTLLGGAGDDGLSGGAGRDAILGGTGTDRCDPGSPGLGRGDRVQGCET